MPTAETESPAKNAESGRKQRTPLPREKDRVDSFARRHIGPNQQARSAMLAEVGFEDLDALIDATVPKNIRLDQPLNLTHAASERRAEEYRRALVYRRRLFRHHYASCNSTEHSRESRLVHRLYTLPS